MRWLIYLVAIVAMLMPSIISAQEQTTASAHVLPPDIKEAPGTIVTVGVTLKISPAETKEFLGAYSATLEWNPKILEFVGYTGGTSNEFSSPNVNQKEAPVGRLRFNGLNVNGAQGTINVINLRFKVVGKVGEKTLISLKFSALSAAQTFTDLLPQLEVSDGWVEIISSTSVHFFTWGQVKNLFK